MESVLKQLETYLLETLDFPNVSVLSSRASLTYDLSNQVYILDLPNTRQSNNYNKYDLYGFAVKDKIDGEAKRLCEKIEYDLSQKMGGKLIEKDDYTPFNGFVKTQSTTYLPSSQATSENTTIYQTNFEFVYQDTNFFKQF